MGLKEILITIGIVVAAVGLIILAVWLRARLLVKKGVYTRKKVAGILSGYAALRRYKVLKDVSIPVSSGSVLCDFVVVGIFGVLVVNCLEANGEVYCNLSADRWAVAGKKKTVKVENPIKRTEKGVFAMREHFSRQKLYKMQIDSISVYSPKSVPCDAGGLPLVSLKKLKSMLEREKYHTDNGVDMEKVARVLTGGSL